LIPFYTNCINEDILFQSINRSKFLLDKSKGLQKFDYCFYLDFILFRYNIYEVSSNLLALGFRVVFLSQLYNMTLYYLNSLLH